MATTAITSPFVVVGVIVGALVMLVALLQSVSDLPTTTSNGLAAACETSYSTIVAWAETPEIVSVKSSAGLGVAFAAYQICG